MKNPLAYVFTIASCVMSLLATIVLFDKAASFDAGVLTTKAQVFGPVVALIGVSSLFLLVSAVCKKLDL